MASESGCCPGGGGGDDDDACSDVSSRECKQRRLHEIPTVSFPQTVATLPPPQSPPPPPPPLSPQCTDLIVLGINYKSSEESVRSYFEQFGALALCEIKRDYNGVSKGFGFIRFRDYKSQTRVLKETHHVVDGRACQVKIPESKHGPNTLAAAKSAHSMRKIFVARLPQGTTPEDLRAYFSQFGEVVDVYIGQPFRAFGFVTFRDTACIPLLYSQQHFLNGASLHIGPAEPKGSSVGDHLSRSQQAPPPPPPPPHHQHLITAIQNNSLMSNNVSQQQQQHWNSSQTMSTFLAHAIQQKMNQTNRATMPVAAAAAQANNTDIATATAAALAAAAAAASQSTGGTGADISHHLMQMFQQPNLMAGFIAAASQQSDARGWETAATAAALAAATATSITSSSTTSTAHQQQQQRHAAAYYNPSSGPNSSSTQTDPTRQNW